MHDLTGWDKHLQTKLARRQLKSGVLRYEQLRQMIDSSGLYDFSEPDLECIRRQLSEKMPGLPLAAFVIHSDEGRY